MQNQEQLQQLVNELDKSHIDYRIVGGVARRAYTGEGLGDLKEIDLITSQEAKTLPAQRVAIHTIWSKFNTQGLRIDTYPSECILLGTDSVSAKVLGQQFNLPPTLFSPVNKIVCGVEFKTVDPLTLLHLFSGFGVVRRKDWKHMLDLGRCIKRDNSSAFSEDDFQTWHQNLRRIYQENKATVLFLQIKRTLNNLFSESTINALRPFTEKPLQSFYALAQYVDKLPNAIK